MAEFSNVGQRIFYINCMAVFTTNVFHVSLCLFLTRALCFFVSFFHVNSQAKEVWQFVDGDRNNVSRATVLAPRVLILLL